jgi:hypothetical protein
MNIKCGREKIEMRNGDTVMDNGASRLLISRDRYKGPPQLSKATFAKFISSSHVTIKTDHSYGESVTLYIYNKP